jgi:hypothetical protein
MLLSAEPESPELNDACKKESGAGAVDTSKRAETTSSAKKTRQKVEDGLRCDMFK